MRKQSSVKYYRTSIALSLEVKPQLDERLAALGLNTVGDVLAMFARTPGVVDALAPIAKQYLEDRKTRVGTKSEVLAKLRKLSPEELDRLMKIAKELGSKAPE